MTSDQWEHLTKIQDSFIALSTSKYQAGQAEHGGNLWDNSEISLIESAILEAIDQVVYLITLRDKLLFPSEENETLNPNTK